MLNPSLTSLVPAPPDGRAADRPDDAAARSSDVDFADILGETETGQDTLVPKTEDNDSEDVVVEDTALPEMSDTGIAHPHDTAEPAGEPETDAPISPRDIQAGQAPATADRATRSEGGTHALSMAQPFESKEKMPGERAGGFISAPSLSRTPKGPTTGNTPVAHFSEGRPDFRVPPLPSARLEGANHHGNAHMFARPSPRLNADAIKTSNILMRAAQTAAPTPLVSTPVQTPSAAGEPLIQASLHAPRNRLSSHTQGPAPSSVTGTTASSMTAPVPGMQPGLAIHSPTADLARERVRSDPVPHSDLQFTADPATIARHGADAPLAKPEIPRHMAMQIADAIQRGGAHRPVDLTLNPAELGRVKISLGTSDGSVLVQIIADRPETLDLMRRHADMLAQEFHAIGYGQARFSFSHQGSGAGETGLDQHANDGSPRVTPSDPVLPDPADGPRLPAAVITDRVDIRV